MDSLLSVNSEQDDAPQNFTERRQWTRIPPEIVATTIYYMERKIPATIVNESFGGVGLAVDREPGIPVGTTIGVLYYGFLTKAIVRFSRAITPDQHRMGVEWC